MARPENIDTIAAVRKAAARDVAHRRVRGRRPAGAAEFIEKPFSDETILAAINGVMARRDDRNALAAERRQILERLATLSQREREVLDGLVAGHANKVIAFDLDISARTVEVYRANAMAKMQARSLSEVVRMMTIAEIGASAL